MRMSRRPIRPSRWGAVCGLSAAALVAVLLSAALTWVLLTPPARAVTPARAGQAPQTTSQHGTWPISPPRVVERFNPPDGPYSPGHRGVDLGGYPGAPVHTALAGTVSFSGVIAGRGVVVVDHGATRTTYEPVLAGPPVGTEVAEGDVIGHVSPVGSHCAPATCLHWGWLRGTTYLDPLLLVGGGPVRLLPLTAGDGEPSVPRPSSPGMGLLVGPAQPIGGDVGVDLRRRQRRMTEEFLHGPQIGAPFE